MPFSLAIFRNCVTVFVLYSILYTEDFSLNPFVAADCVFMFEYYEDFVFNTSLYRPRTETHVIIPNDYAIGLRYRGNYLEHYAIGLSDENADYVIIDRCSGNLR